MSRIETVACDRLTAALHTPFVTALRRTTTTHTVVVRITDSDGVTGWGEAPLVWQVTGESLVCGSVSRAVARNFGAKATVDSALHDFAARRRGVSLPVVPGLGAEGLA